MTKKTYFIRNRAFLTWLYLIILTLAGFLDKYSNFFEIKNVVGFVIIITFITSLFIEIEVKPKNYEVII